jgi:hypothetical protein
LKKDIVQGILLEIVFDPSHSFQNLLSVRHCPE